MNFAPLSLLPKQPSSPNKLINRHDSLIFSITSEKMNSRKQTLLLQESKELKPLTQQPILDDYFLIQDKINRLEEKVENIRTSYCESERMSIDDDKNKENTQGIINLQFPEEIYENNPYTNGAESTIGKIMKKRPKYYTGIQQKPGKKSRSISKNEQSIMSTKRNNLTAYSISKINDFSAYRGKNTSFRQQNNQPTPNDTRDFSRQRSSSFSVTKKQNNNSFIGGRSNDNNIDKALQLKRVRQQLVRNRKSNEKLQRKSKESERKLSVSKNEAKKFKDENAALNKQISVLKQKLKKSDTIKQRQKQTILKQKEEITELRILLEECLKRNNSFSLNKENQCEQNKGQGKIANLKSLRS